MEHRALLQRASRVLVTLSRTWFPRQYERAAGGPQLEYYQQCLAKHRTAHKYMAFIDSDEVQTLLLPSPAHDRLRCRCCVVMGRPYPGSILERSKHFTR